MSIPYIPQGTSKRFRVPRTLQADFDAFLAQDIPNTVMDFEVVKSWYDRNDEDYVPRLVRGEIYPDATKSRYENTDNALNIRCSVTSGIQKGDMLIQPDKSVFILDWFVSLQSNNAPSRCLRCNMMLNVKRYTTQEEMYDQDGYLLDKAGSSWREIVPPIPCNAYRYDGRPEYTVLADTAGANPNSLTLLTVQFNERTRDIHLDDVFQWYDEAYKVVDVSFAGVNLQGTAGIIKIEAKKAEGGKFGYGEGEDTDSKGDYYGSEDEDFYG